MRFDSRFDKSEIKPGDIVRLDLVWDETYAMVLSGPRPSTPEENRKMGVLYYDSFEVVETVRMDTGEREIVCLDDIEKILLDNEKGAC